LLYVFGCFLLALSAVPLLAAIGSGSLLAFRVATLVGLSINYPIMFGPQSHLYSELFPEELHYSGISIGAQSAGALGGGLAPLIATSLVARYGSIQAVGLYLAMLGLLGALCAHLMRSATIVSIRGTLTVQSEGEIIDASTEPAADWRGQKCTRDPGSRQSRGIT
jgi:MFS family permease